MKILKIYIALPLLLALTPLTLSAANDSTKTQFDEVDSLFGKRVEVQMIRVAQND